MISEFLNLPPLYPITDATRPESLADQVRALGQAGFPLVQFRGKPLDPKAQWDQLRQAMTEAAANGGWPQICVNDRADLALLAAQEGLPPWGLHLGQGDLPPVEALRLPGLSSLHVGASTHSVEEWASVDLNCDHAGVGPFRATATKGDHAAPVGLQGLHTGCLMLRSRGLAPVAIGGLTEDDLRACYEAGAESLAMVAGIARCESPRELLWRAQLSRWQAQPLQLRKGGLVLVGGSGCGKSTLGKVLAQRMGLPVVDLDEAVASAAGKPIAHIFAEAGEAAFRTLEAEALLGALASPCVLALGGGAWASEAVRKRLQDSDFQVLWINENPATAWDRIAHDPARPLAKDRADFMARWRQRMVHWDGLPMILPLGRSPEALVQAMGV